MNLKLNKNGFTLIELIVVMVLVAILSVYAATRFDLSAKNIETVTKALRSNIQFAQELAMTRGAVYGFRSIDATNYEIYETAPGTPAINPLTNTNFTVNISPVQFSGTVPAVPFQTNGHPNIVSSAVITLVSGTVTKTVIVQLNTGFVTIGP